MVGIYSLTGSVSSSSGVVPPQLLSQELLISPWCHELKFPDSWNVVPQYMVHHHMEIAQIERWQIVSSLVHSSLVVHCSYRLKFLKDSFLSNCCLRSVVGLDHVQSPWWQTLIAFPSAPRNEKHNNRHLIENLWVPSIIYPSGKCKIVLIAAHSWDNIPWDVSRSLKCLTSYTLYDALPWFS